MAKKMGRPSDYSDAKALEICRRLSEGESLRSICRDETMPDKTTVLRWLSLHADFRTQYAHAREMQTEFWAEEILDIADDGSNDTYVDEKGNERVDHDVVNRSKLRVDTRKWLMSKLAPKKYGDKIELGGSVGIRHEDALKQLA